MGTQPVRALQILAAVLVVAVGVSGTMVARRPPAPAKGSIDSPATTEVIGPFPLLKTAGDDLPGTVCFELLWGGSTVTGEPAGWYLVNTFDRGMRERFAEEFATRTCTTPAAPLK